MALKAHSPMLQSRHPHSCLRSQFFWHPANPKALQCIVPRQGPLQGF